MVYISNGNLVDGRTTWRLSAIPDLFWGIINFFVLFFQTMFQPNLTKHGAPPARSWSGRQPPPPPPGRRFGGFGSRRGAPAAPPPPMMGGG